MIIKTKKEQTCSFPKCESSNYGGGRGLCKIHYAGCTYHVKKGNKTWEEFEKMGVCNKRMSQADKNINQMHPHKSYKQEKSKYDF